MSQKSFFGRSTYELDAGEVRRKKRTIRNLIIRAYRNPITRWYCRIRFQIMNIDFLDTLEQHLGEADRILDIGCGFGLFALYYASSGPARQVSGFDISSTRIAEAQQVAQKLNLSNTAFFCQDAATYQFSESFDVVVTLDLLHHVSPGVAEQLISQAYQALNSNGILIIKDINTTPAHKLYFTYAVDMAMTPRWPVHYRSTRAWQAVLMQAGFKQVFAYPLNDFLPYPHVLLVAYKSPPRY